MSKAISFSLAASVGLLAALLFAGSQVPAAPADPPPCPTTRPTVLDATLADVRFPSIPLERALEQLGQLTHANIVVEWRQLEAVGIARSAPVRVQLWDVKLGQALKIVLADVSDDLGFQAQDGIVTVSTCERLATNDVMRIYDIRPLIQALVRLAPDQPPSRNEAAQAIVDLIEAIVEPETWKDNGGNESIREFLGMLVVIQTPANQQKLQTLLDELQSGQGPHIVQFKRLASHSSR